MSNMSFEIVITYHIHYDSDHLRVKQNIISTEKLQKLQKLLVNSNVEFANSKMT